MSTKTFKKVFTDKKKLNSMLELRRQGWSFPTLAMLFRVDTSSIYYECKKYNIQKQGNLKFDVTFIISLFDIHSRRSKTYQEYLQESKQRRDKNHFPISPLKKEDILLV